MFTAFVYSANVNAQQDPIIQLEEPNGNRIICVDISNDDRFLAIGSHNSSSIMDVKTGTVITTNNDLFYTTTLDFSPDNKLIISGGGYDNATILWDTLTGNLLRKLNIPFTQAKGKINEMRKVAFTPNGKRILTLDNFGLLQIWDVDSGEEYRNFKNIIHSTDLLVLDDSHMILFNSVIREIQFWDFEKMEKVKSIPKSFKPILSNNRRYLKYNAYDDTRGWIRVMDLETERIIWEYEIDHLHYVIPEVTAISSNGEFVIIGGLGNEGNRFRNFVQRQIFSTNSTTALRSYPLDQTSKNTASSEDNHILFFPDGKKYLTVNGNKIFIWDISDLAANVEQAEKY
jgi:WD40 repeat protein